MAMKVKNHENNSYKILKTSCENATTERSWIFLNLVFFGFSFEVCETEN